MIIWRNPWCHQTDELLIFNRVIFRSRVESEIAGFFVSSNIRIMGYFKLSKIEKWLRRVRAFTIFIFLSVENCLWYDVINIPTVFLAVKLHYNYKYLSETFGGYVIFSAFIFKNTEIFGGSFVLPMSMFLQLSTALLHMDIQTLFY